MKIRLAGEIIRNDEIIDEIDLDLTKLTGRDLIQSEKTARMLSGNDFSAWNSTHITCIAAAASGLTYDEIINLPAKDFMSIQMSVANFFNDTASQVSQVNSSDAPF